jgi:small conductance mechanosensitive channel
MLEILQDIVNPATLTGGLFYAAMFLMIVFITTRTIRRGVHAILDRDKDERISRSAARFSIRAAQGAVMVLAVVVYAHLVPSLRSLGTGLLASAGLLTVVAGLAAQGTLANLIAGITLMLYRPFKVGEVVQLQTPCGLESGKLEKISLGYTIVRTYDGRRIVVPNTVMAGQITVNLSSSDMLGVIDLQLDFDADIKRARALTLEAANAHRSVHSLVGCPLTTMGGQGVVLSLRFMCHSVDDVFQTKVDLLEILKEEFDRDGISFFHASTTIELQNTSSS